MAPSEEQHNTQQQDAEHFRLLMENVADYAIFTLDAQGRISSWNEGAQRILGYTAQEIIGQLPDPTHPVEPGGFGENLLEHERVHIDQSDLKQMQREDR